MFGIENLIYRTDRKMLVEGASHQSATMGAACHGRVAKMSDNGEVGNDMVL